MRDQEKSRTVIVSSRGPTDWMRWIPAVILILIFLLAVFISGRIILVPLLSSLALAYMLAPAVNWFERRGWSRPSSVFLTITATSLLLVLSLIFVVPGLWAQLTKSYRQAHSMISDDSRTSPLLHNIRQFSPQIHQIAESQVKRFRDPDELGRMVSLAGGWLQGGLFRLVNLTTSILDLLLIPFFVYYLLADYRSMRKRFDRLIPPRYRDLTSSLISQINYVLSSYVRNQLLIAVLMGILYSAGFAIFRVPLALTLGFLSGLLNFIPYLGTITGLAVSLIFVVLDGAGIGRILGVIIVFTIVQCIEGYYLTPKLLGSRLHLHPLWVLAGLVIGGHLFGLIGIILTVPGIAIAKVVFGFLEDIYQQSDYYRRSGLGLLTDQGHPLDSLPPAKPSNLILEDPSPPSTRRTVITTGELRSRIKETQSDPEN